MVRVFKLGLALAPSLTMKVLIRIRVREIMALRSKPNFYFLNFFQKCHSGLPDGEDGQVEADHGSLIGPEGTHLLKRNWFRISMNFNKSKILQKGREKAAK